MAAQAALIGRTDSKSNPPKEKSRATRSIRLDDDDVSETMADAPAALPGGELRVRPQCLVLEKLHGTRVVFFE